MCKCNVNRFYKFSCLYYVHIFNLRDCFVLFGIICVIRPSTKVNTKPNSSSDTVSQSNGKQSDIGSQNGKANDTEEEKEEQEEAAHGNNEQKKKKKNKSRQRNKRLLKKEAREIRAKVMSQDMDVFKFSNVSLSENQDAVEVFQNGDSHDKPTSSRMSQKRNQAEDYCEPKRRKSSNRA